MDADGIREVLDKLGLKYGRVYTSPKYGENLLCSCPLAPWNHQDPNDSNKSCSIKVNPEGPSVARCHSFSCDFHGSFYMLIQKAVLARNPPSKELLDLVTAVGKTEEMNLERLFERVESVEVKSTAAVVEGTVAVALPEPKRSKIKPTIPAAWERDVLSESRLDDFDPEPHPYVLGRGLTVETIKRWELRFDRRLNRVVFPVRRFDGKLIGMTGRILPEVAKEMEAAGREATKYHNYVGLNKTRYLYGAHLLESGKTAIVTEGPFDAMKTDQALRGRACATATLGQGFGEDHSTTLRGHHVPCVFIFMDGDGPGLRAAEKIVAQLNTRDNRSLKLMRTSGGKDPGEMTEAAIVESFERATIILGSINWDAPIF